MSGKTLISRRTAAVMIASAGVLIVIKTCFAFVNEVRTFEIRGRVIAKETKEPVSNAMVAVASHVPGVEGPRMGDHVLTDRDGFFSAKARGEVLLDVWKPGFGVSPMLVGKAATLARQQIVIELYEAGDGNSVPMHRNTEGMYPGDGFSFKSGGIVEGDDPDADFRIVTDGDGQLYVQTFDKGGLIFIPAGDSPNFLEVPLAPSEGYEKQLHLEPGGADGTYFMRTRDGAHYAKFRFMEGWRDTDTRRDGSFYWLLWAYQPDGTRYLAILPGKEFPFPMEEFGLRR